MDEERIEGGGEEGRTREKIIKREGICVMYLRGDQGGREGGREKQIWAGERKTHLRAENNRGKTGR